MRLGRQDGEVGELRQRPAYVVSGLLLLFAAYEAWTGFRSGSFIGWMIAAFSIAAAVGAFGRRAWARWLVWGLAVLVIGTWLSITMAIAKRGWPEPDPLRSVFALIPGVALVATWLGMAFAVRNYRCGGRGGS